MSDICALHLNTILNNKLTNEKQCFDNLKLASVTPVSKKRYTLLNNN